MSELRLIEDQVSIYKALQEHKEFWTGWINLRTMQMADSWLPKDEVDAAKALKEALKELNKTAEDLGLIDVVASDSPKSKETQE